MMVYHWSYCHPQSDPFSDGNVRVPVHLANNGDLMPMNSFFSETEILELCISDDWYAKRWRQKYSPMSQAKDFFWYADDIDEKPDLRDMVEAAKAARFGIKQSLLNVSNNQDHLFFIAFSIERS